MATLCAIRGCPGSYRGKKRGEKIYYFKALEEQLEEWNRVIPGNRKIDIHDKVCSRHFKDDDLIKEWKFVIDDKTVTMPRGRWTLKVGAVPAIFDGYEDDPRARMDRKSRPRSLIDVGGTSSDEVHEGQRRKRIKKSKMTRSPKAVRNSVKRASKISNTDLKPRATPPENASWERNDTSANQADDTSWEKACDSFVDELSFICTPTPAKETAAKPAKRRPGRPPKVKLGSRCSKSGRPSKVTNAQSAKRRPGRPPKAKQGSRCSKSGRPSKVTNAQPAKRRPGRPPKAKQGRPCKEEGWLTKAGRGRPPKAKRGRPRSAEPCPKGSLVSQNTSLHDHSAKLERKKSPTVGLFSNLDTENSVIIEEFVAPGCDETIDVDDTVPSCKITCKYPSNVTVKEEERYDGYKNYHSLENNLTDSCATTISEESTVREGQIAGKNVRNYERVVVKRELCDCDGGDSQCCGPQTSSDRSVVELPASSVPSEGSNKPVEELKTERGECGRKSSQLPREISITSASWVIDEAPRSKHEACLEKLPLTLKSRLQVDGSSDVEMDFFGFSSDEEEELALKRMHFFENTAEMADKSAKLHFSRLSKLCSSVPGKSYKESGESSGNGQKQKPCVGMATDPLEDLASMLPVCSTTPLNNAKNVSAPGSASHSKEAPIQEGKFTSNSNLGKERSAFDFSYDEVLKFGQISSEVTVIKAPKPSKGLHKVTSASRVSQGLEEVRSSSTDVQLAREPNLRTYSPRGNLILNKTGTNLNYQRKGKVPPSSNQDHLKDKVAPSSNRDHLKDKANLSSNQNDLKDKVTPSSNQDHLKDKVTPLSNQDHLKDEVNLSSNQNDLKDKVTPSSNQDHLKDKVTLSSNQDHLKDKVAITSNHGLFKDQGTSAAQHEPPKDKIPTSYFAPPTDRLSHLMAGSSLDRILRSSRNTSLLDSHTAYDPAVDKTSLILKNFKSDGVLALECVVLKEQVRQLQKELFLHKRMLVDSEHNASLLQRKLELQAQVPCQNCMNFKRGLVGKETLI